jgi:hypothetical protein
MVTTTATRGTARETASLVLQSLASRISEAMRRPAAEHPMLMPTVFVEVRRGETVTYQDVVARRV